MFGQKDSLSLYFGGEYRPELYRAVFEHRLLESECRAVRGCYTGPDKGSALFYWSASVQAMSLFFVKVAQTYLESEELFQSKPVLSGASGSAAASLDYAIARQSNWLCDIFGSDSKGNCLARRFITRTNPERKRPGPVTISLNPRMLSPNAIHIYLNDSEIRDPKTLRQMAGGLEGKWKKGRATAKRSAVYSDPNAIVLESPVSFDPEQMLPEPFSRQRGRQVLEAILRDEIYRLLRRNMPSSRVRLRNALSRLENISAFKMSPRKRASFFDRCFSETSPRSRLGVLGCEEHALLMNADEQPIRVIVAAGTVGSIALFYYLKHFRRYNIVIDFSFIHGSELLERLNRDSFNEHTDVCVLGVVQAAKLLASSHGRNFLALCIMAGISFDVVAPLSGRGKGRTINPETSRSLLGSGDYYGLLDNGSTSSVYLEELVQKGGRQESGCKLHHMLPDETTELLASGNSDMRAIMWFPNYNFNLLFNNCVALDQGFSKANIIDNFLVAHRSFLENQQKSHLLTAAIYDAWLSLVENPNTLDLLVHRMAGDSHFVTFLSRMAGLHNLDRIQDVDIPKLVGAFVKDTEAAQA